MAMENGNIAPSSQSVRRTHYSAQVLPALNGQSVVLAGWVHRRRDHGGVIFLDLRDISGYVQVVVSPDTPAAFASAEKVRSEYVLRIHGTVRQRPTGTENLTVATGAMEVMAHTIEILNAADPLPFPVDEHGITVHEELRLKHRYLDLRQPNMAHRLKMRHQMNHVIRSYLNTHGFWEIETPYLTKATPEGARDYLVPSRTHPGSYFALPQSPQQFKQLLMVSGMDRYYQIVRCFRDEDLRADRQPEFTQLDMELSFTDEAEIQGIIEGLMVALIQALHQKAVPIPFPRMTYDQAMCMYGSDKPDLRNPLVLVDCTDWMRTVSFAVFRDAATQPGGRVSALRVPGGATCTRKQIDDYTRYVAQWGARGLAYIKITDVTDLENGFQSPIVKFLSPDVLQRLVQDTGAQSGDLIFFGAAHHRVVEASLGALRQKIGQDLGLIDADALAFLWVVDFPMFEYDEKSNRWHAAHHPFTHPQVDSVAALQTADNGQLRARAYDLVLNGFEVGGGSIRIHQAPLQQAVFERLGLSEETIADKFGHLLQAFAFGCPPHGGIALGLDRLAMILSYATSIREVIAFPKTQSASCLLMGAPAAADPEQLETLGIANREDTTAHGGT